MSIASFTSAIADLNLPIDRSSTREKWTVMKYMNDFHLMTTYAEALRRTNALTEENISGILAEMEAEGIYRPREGVSVDTGNFKIIQIAWYMFGYYDKWSARKEKNRVVFTPLGNLLLDNLDDSGKTAKILLAMLFGNGFRNPYSQMDERFNIYAYRLVFRLLCDPRLGGVLHHDEVFYFAMFLKTVDDGVYERLVRAILAFRGLAPSEKFSLFKRDEAVVAQALHEWTYAAGLLESGGIVTVDEGESIGILVHGKGTGRRKYKVAGIGVRPEIAPFMKRMLEAHPATEKPYPPEEIAWKFTMELVVEKYNFYPEELLAELKIETPHQRTLSRLLDIAKQVEMLSRNETRMDCYHFEDALADAFNLFRDVVAEKVGGAGNTDVECKYAPPEPARVLKFDVEAKSARLKLPSVNIGRISRHRKKVGSSYTIIVTPEFSKGVLGDIERDRSVLVKSGTLSNYLYQGVSKFGTDLSYSALHGIVVDNYGRDVTGLLNELIFSNFGHSCSCAGGAGKARPAEGMAAVGVRSDGEVAEALRFTRYLPLYSLRAACGKFGRGEEVEPEGWVEVEGGRLDRQMFAVRARGKSMEPKIHDGDLCVMKAGVEGSRDGRIVLAEHRGTDDPDGGGAYSIKRYHSEKRADGESWRHEKIWLEPLNKSFESIDIPEDAGDEFRIVAEWLEGMKAKTT